MGIGESGNLTLYINTTCDLEHYVVQLEIGEQTYIDLTEPFDTQDEAVKWCERINSAHSVRIATDF